MKKIKVYVAGPITLGNVAHNLRRAILLGDELWREGFVPFVPHAHYIWEVMCHHTEQEWLMRDLDWLLECDALIRLEGESVGAAVEEQYAIEHGIPVFRGIAALKLWAEGLAKLEKV